MFLLGLPETIPMMGHRMSRPEVCQALVVLEDTWQGPSVEWLVELFALLWSPWLRHFCDGEQIDETRQLKRGSPYTHYTEIISVTLHFNPKSTVKLLLGDIQ